MDLLLQRHRSITLQTGETEPITYVKDLFDEVVLFLNNTTNNPTDGLYILTVICSDLAGFPNRKVFTNPEIMNHQFFIIVSNTFRMLLTKVTFISLTKQDEQCFDGISLLINSLCLNNNQISSSFYIDNNEQFNPNNKEKFNLLSYEKIFFTDLFIRKFVRILENDIAVNDYEPYHIKYKIIDRLLRLCIKLKNIDHKLILDSVVKCIKSEIYINLYKTIDLRQPLPNPKQLFFMYQCPKFIRLCSHKQQDDISYSLSELITKYSADIFEKHLPIALEGEFVLVKKGRQKYRDAMMENIASYDESVEKSQPKDKGAKIQVIAWYIEFLNHVALTPTTREFFIRKISPDKTIVDQMIEILETESLIESVQVNAELFHADVALISYSITLLYNLIREKKIFYHLKDKSVINVCENLYTAEDKTIQFASRTLGAILNQEDIDEINNPRKIVESCLYFIENTIDDATLTYHGIKLDGVLTNLETIVQNDDVKEEIINDDEGISLIGRCTYEPNLDVETIQLPALRIIDSISFVNDSAREQIKDNDILMDHIKNLLKKDDKNQAPIANRIVWKVEEESEFILKQKKQAENARITIKRVFDEKKAIYQYIRGDHRFHLVDQELPEIFDIMISYSPDDKELASKIYNRLIASNVHRVSFDKDNIHNSNPKAMAKVIEQSAMVIVCCSTKYRNSNACRLEAEYANTRKRRIIPVKVDPQYDPAGWLGELIKEKKCIDFTKEFNTAYGELIETIDKVNEESYTNQ